MSAQFINVIDLVYRAYTLGVEHDDSRALSKAQIVSLLFDKCPVEHHESESEAESVGKGKGKGQKKERKARGPAKPRAVPDDECRCCARAYSEEAHVEGGKLKVMRDDEANLYGDRCKFKKAGESNFCKHHTEKQPNGVWGGEYAGKFKQIMAKAAKSAAASSASESESDKDKPKIVIKKAKIVLPAAAAPSAAAAAKPAAEKPKEVAPKHKEAEKPKDKKKVILADDEEIFSDDEELVAKPKAKKITTTLESIELDDIALFIDNTGNVYDPQDDGKIGKYDRKTKKWLSGGMDVYYKKYEGETDTDDDETDDE